MGRPLHGHAALGVAGMREAVRMRLRLHGAVGGIQRRLVDGKLRRQSEQLEKSSFNSFPNKRAAAALDHPPVSRAGKPSPAFRSRRRGPQAGRAQYPRLAAFTLATGELAPARRAPPPDCVHGRDCQGGSCRTCWPCRTPARRPSRRPRHGDNRRYGAASPGGVRRGRTRRSRTRPDIGVVEAEPSFRPRGQKSSSVPSMYGRLFGSTITLMPCDSNTLSSGSSSSTYSSL